MTIHRSPNPQSFFSLNAKVRPLRAEFNMATGPQYASLWRILGLSVAASYAGLGSYAVFAPLDAASLCGLRPKIGNPEAAVEADRCITDAMAWIGGRDLSIAAALFALYYQREPVAMGSVILCSMILCVADGVTVFRNRNGDWFAWMMAAGAGMWGVIGWNLTEMRQKVPAY